MILPTIFGRYNFPNVTSPFAQPPADSGGQWSERRHALSHRSEFSASRFALDNAQRMYHNKTHKANVAHEHNATRVRIIPKGFGDIPGPCCAVRRAEALRPLTAYLVEPSTELDVRCVSLTGIKTSA